jgi:molecular chaperone GrpE (heat shock protein)
VRQAIERFLAGVGQVLRDRVAIVRLRFEIARLKLNNYDRLVESNQGLRRALETQNRALDDLHRQLADREGQIKALQSEYTALEQRSSQSEAVSLADERLDIFKRIQSIATQLPTLRAAVASGAELTARDVLDLLAPLDEMLRDLGFEVIGEAGGQMSYDPTRHRPVGQGARSVAAGDVVKTRYVGYLHQGQVICKAEVIRVEQPEMTPGG